MSSSRRLTFQCSRTSGSHWKLRWVTSRHASSLLLESSSGEKTRNELGLSSMIRFTYSPTLYRSQQDSTCMYTFRQIRGTHAFIFEITSSFCRPKSFHSGATRGMSASYVS